MSAQREMIIRWLEHQRQVQLDAGRDNIALRDAALLLYEDAEKAAQNAKDYDTLRAELAFTKEQWDNALETAETATEGLAEVVGENDNLKAQLAALQAEKAAVVVELRAGGWEPELGNLIKDYERKKGYAPDYIYVQSEQLARWLAEAQEPAKVCEMCGGTGQAPTPGFDGFWDIPCPDCQARQDEADAARRPSQSVPGGLDGRDPGDE
jgi:hypothetical protein